MELLTSFESNEHGVNEKCTCKHSCVSESLHVSVCGVCVCVCTRLLEYVHTYECFSVRACVSINGQVN